MLAFAPKAKSQNYTSCSEFETTSFLKKNTLVTQMQEEGKWHRNKENSFSSGIYNPKQLFHIAVW